jgi:hypothetical protein
VKGLVVVVVVVVVAVVVVVVVVVVLLLPLPLPLLLLVHSERCADAALRDRDPEKRQRLRWWQRQVSLLSVVRERQFGAADAQLATSPTG